jgi:hypothetical protein
MTHLAPITMDDGTIVYLQAADDLEMTAFAAPDAPGRVAKGGSERLQQSFTSIKGTIKSYTAYALDAFKELGSANVEKVTLEFGIKVAGKAGIPYITEGSTEGNLKITVECNLAKGR